MREHGSVFDEGKTAPRIIDLEKEGLQPGFKLVTKNEQRLWNWVAAAIGALSVR
jgi:hypothetical protein